MTLQDSRGIPLSTRSPSLVQQYEQALDLSLGYFLDPLAKIQGALEVDPSFASGHCLRAALMVMSTDRAALPVLRESVEAIESPGTHANDRERAHAAAARLWLQGDFVRAVRSYGEILVEYPHDLLAMQTAHIGDFFLGASSMLRDRIAQVVPAWDAHMPGYGYVLGMYAFGLEETNLYSRAEDMGRRALELNARDPWAVHAVAHVMEMQGRLREGVDWLVSRQADWSVHNGFAFHNWWHLALLHLDAGDHAQVLQLFDTCIRPQDTQAPLEMIDASAMLWRLTLRGVDVGDRWQKLAACWAPSADHAYYAFNDVHAVMSFVGAGRFDLAELTMSAMQRKALEQDTNAMMTREVGLPMARGLSAFVRGDYAQTVDQLTNIRTVAHRFGGSHAQRDLIHLTLTEAALRAGRPALARALTAERTQLKPTSPFNWRLAAQAAELSGDMQGSMRARETAELRRRIQFAAPRAA